MEAHPAAVCILIFALALFLMAVRSTGWNSFTAGRMAGGGASPPLIGRRGAVRRPDWLRGRGRRSRPTSPASRKKAS